MRHCNNLRQRDLAPQLHRPQVQTARSDAALWARDGCMMMSSGLPDNMTQEQNEGESDSVWGTAHIIKKMFGTQAAWAAKVAAEYGNPQAQALKAVSEMGLLNTKISRCIANKIKEEEGTNRFLAEKYGVSKTLVG